MGEFGISGGGLPPAERGISGTGMASDPESGIGGGDSGIAGGPSKIGTKSIADGLGIKSFTALAVGTKALAAEQSGDFLGTKALISGLGTKAGASAFGTKDLTAGLKVIFFGTKASEVGFGTNAFAPDESDDFEGTIGGPVASAKLVGFGLNSFVGFDFAAVVGDFFAWALV